MTAVDRTPSNLNYLSPLNFKISLKRAPHIEFFIQHFDLPGIALPGPEFKQPFQDVPIPGEHMTFDDLRIEFIVDEDLKNYLEIHNWIRALGKPTKFEEYAEIASQTSYSGNGIYSDITLSILTNLKNANYEINFIDCWPTALSGMSFLTTDEDVKYITATATFKYNYYDIVLST